MRVHVRKRRNEEFYFGAILIGNYPDYRIEFSVCLLIDLGRIIQIRKCSHTDGKKIKNNYSNLILLPALVNAHTHLELSALEDVVNPGIGMSSFIKKIVEARRLLTLEQMQMSIDRQIQELIDHGTLFVGDISNHGYHFRSLVESDLEGILFLEILGLDPQEATRNLNHMLERQYSLQEMAGSGAHRSWETMLNPHSPYSLSLDLSKLLWSHMEKNESRRRACIHFAESLEEIDFMNGKDGPMRDLFMKFTDAPLTALSYYEALQFWSDHCRFFVHGSELTDDGFELMKEKNVGLVLCPRSNLFLHNRTVNIKKAISSDLVCALATDSLASNQDLNLWSEAKHAQHLFHLEPAKIFQMITINPAILLDINDRYGSIAPGKATRWVGIPMDSMQDLWFSQHETQYNNFFGNLFLKAVEIEKTIFL